MIVNNYRFKFILVMNDFQLSFIYESMQKMCLNSEGIMDVPQLCIVTDMKEWRITSITTVNDY